jgi:hypothetical protein
MHAADIAVILCADRGCACSAELADIEAIHKAVAEGEQQRGQAAVHAAVMCHNIRSSCIVLCSALQQPAHMHQPHSVDWLCVTCTHASATLC